MKKETTNYSYYFNSLKKSPVFFGVEDNVLHEILEMFQSKKYLKDNLEIERNSRNALVLFEATLHIILADGMMTESECEFLADIGELLQIPTSKMFARIGLFLRQEKEVVVAPPENFDWLYGGESDSDFY